MSTVLLSVCFLGVRRFDGCEETIFGMVMYVLRLTSTWFDEGLVLGGGEATCQQPVRMGLLPSSPHGWYRDRDRVGDNKMCLKAIFSN